MTLFFLKLRRKILYSVVSKLAKFADPHAVVRNNLIESAELEAAFKAFDDRNVVKALQIFRDFGEKDDPAAQHNLGVLYETATGVLSRQDDLAEEWYRKAADQGLAEAQYNLAAILVADAMAGQAGHSASEQHERFVEGYMWLILANARSHPLATASLRRLEPHMTEKQLNEADSRARNWRHREKE